MAGLEPEAMVDKLFGGRVAYHKYHYSWHDGRNAFIGYFVLVDPTIAITRAEAVELVRGNFIGGVIDDEEVFPGYWLNVRGDMIDFDENNYFYEGGEAGDIEAALIGMMVFS